MQAKRAGLPEILEDFLKPVSHENDCEKDTNEKPEGEFDH